MRSHDQSARRFAYYFREDPNHVRLFPLECFDATSFALLRDALATERRFTPHLPVLMDVTLAEGLPIGAELFAIVEHWKALLESQPCAIFSANGTQYEVARRLQMFAKRLMVFAQPDQAQRWLREIQSHTRSENVINRASTP